MGADSDRGEALCEAVRRAHETGAPLRIVGSGSKTFLVANANAGAAPAGRPLSLAEHRGVLDYRPEELVVTARAGTPLVELESMLAECGQRLPFEPPRFGGGGTLGGAVACGLSGPGRPWRGAVRDSVLGVELLNGLGERLRFGGQVMKNVAGYDVSRLQAGAFGTLGVLLAVSVRVLPAPACEQTLVFELDGTEALARCRAWALRPYPVTATAHVGELLRVRLSGAQPAVAWAAAELGGEVAGDDGFWAALRDHRLPFFLAAGGGEQPVWRCSVPPGAREPLEQCLTEWGGAERWVRPRDPEAGARLAAAVGAVGGHARPFDGSFGRRVGAPVAAAEGVYNARLKQAFDPGGVLNPELVSPEPPRAN